MSWSEVAAGTLQAQLGHFGVESRGLNLAETRVRSVPGEGLEPSRGKPSQDFKSCASSFRLPENLAAVSSETSGRSTRHQRNGLMISSELFLGLFTKVEIG